MLKNVICAIKCKNSEFWLKIQRGYNFSNMANFIVPWKMWSELRILAKNVSEDKTSKFYRPRVQISKFNNMVKNFNVARNSQI